MSIKVISFTGKEREKYITELAKLRIEVFREFPYLYEGDLKYEKEYLATYATTAESLLVVAFDENEVIGVSTAIPMINETENIKKPFIEKNIDPEKVFYFGESVLKKDYRGKGIGLEFFRHREEYARSLNRFTLLAFCAVERPENHPLRPAEYKPLDLFWKKRGFVKKDDMYCLMNWKEINQPKETSHKLVFWLKAI